LHHAPSPTRPTPLPPSPTSLVRYLLAWLRSLNPPGWEPSKQRTVIYYSRVFPEAKLGRLLDAEHSDDVAKTIQKCLEKNGRDEKLVIFDGTIAGEDGERRSMTLLEQFSLFRSASMALGPHGTGLGEFCLHILGAILLC